jgi:putative tryptophan/tyrosine transport system substrate-binding protein
MKRREFVAGLGSAAAWPLVARGQTQGKRPLIAFLMISAPTPRPPYLTAFFRTMQDLGWAEGRDFDVAYRNWGGDAKLLHSMAAELVQLGPTVIIPGTTPAAVALRQITATVPLVCASLTDPVKLGLAASYARPGGNVTGIVFQVDDLQAKMLELAIEAVPGARKIGTLASSSSVLNAKYQRDEEPEVARRLKVIAFPVTVDGPQQIETAFETLVHDEVQVVVVYNDSMLFANRRRVVEFALKQKLPTIFGYRDNVDAGGLISYGVSLRDIFRRTAALVDKVLKGEKPGDLPIEFPTQLELVINLKTAKAIGLTVPPLLLARADEVIE